MTPTDSVHAETHPVHDRWPLRTRTVSQVHSVWAERDPADNLTIRGDLTKDRAEAIVVPAELRGNELKVLRTGLSLAVSGTCV